MRLRFSRTSSRLLMTSDGSYAALQAASNIQQLVLEYVDFKAPQNLSLLAKTLFSFGPYQKLSWLCLDRCSVRMADSNAEFALRRFLNRCPALQCFKVCNPVFMAEDRYEARTPFDQTLEAWALLSCVPTWPALTSFTLNMWMGFAFLKDQRARLIGLSAREVWHTALKRLPALRALDLDEGCFCVHSFLSDAGSLWPHCLTGILQQGITTLTVRTWLQLHVFQDVTELGHAVRRGRFPNLRTVSVISYSPIQCHPEDSAIKALHAYPINIYHVAKAFEGTGVEISITLGELLAAWSRPRVLPIDEDAIHE
jgi:hypothetical protein